MSHTSYYPEMTAPESRPVGQIEASMGHYGNHWFLRTALVLSGRGVKLLETMTSSTLCQTPAAQKYVGWNRYKVTQAAFDRISQQHEVVSEMML